MKKITYLLAFILGLSLGTFSVHANTSAPTPQEAEAYLTLYGWYVGKEAGISEIGLNDKELSTLFEGFRMAAKNSTPPSGSYELATEMQIFLQERVTAYQKEREAQMATESKTNVKQGEEFFSKLAKNKSIQKSSTGLFYEIKEEGAGKEPEASSKVVVHYEGRLIDGTIFDSSKKRGEPATFPVDGVIPGFKEGILLLAEGGKATLYIPSTLGYGNMSIPGIPAGSTLVFDIELIKVM